MLLVENVNFLKILNLPPLKQIWLKFFSNWPKTKSNCLLVINHTNINICIKAASIVMHKVHVIQTFQMGKSQENSNLLIPNQQISQTYAYMTTNVIHNNQEPVSERSASIQTSTINEKKARKAAEIKKITLSKQIIVKNTTENSDVEPENQCVK